MSDKQGSARVTLREIDLSQVRDPEQLPQGVPAAVVGPAKRGPAFVPKTFADMQQFGEVFGSMQEISKDSNANRFAPLALNEWMRNAQAGTFLRVLGVGNDEGRMNDDKTVAGAGFVVGDKVSHDSSNVLQNNPHAQIDPANVVGATKAARTHLLGCFMKDAEGSTFLKDAGIQLDDASATLTIDFSASDTNNLPAVDSSITLISAQNGNQAGSTVTYTFTNGADSVTNINLTVQTTPQLIANQIAAIITANHANLTATVVQAQGVPTPVVEIRQSAEGEAGNTAVTLDLTTTARNDIKISSGSSETFNSTVDDQIRMDGGGVTSASIDIAVHDAESPVNLDNNNNLKLKALKNDRTLTGEVVITFKNDASFTGDDDEVFDPVGGPNSLTLNVRIGENGLDTLEGQKETLSNLATAINGQNGTQLEGLLTASLSSDGQTLTLTQVNKGNVDDTADAAIIATAKFTMTAASFEIQGTEATGAADQAEHFEGGTDGKGTVTFTFTDQPRVGDSFVLVAANAVTNTFKFIPNDNGNSNGETHDDGAPVINVELGATLAGTMQFIKNAIETDAAANANVVVDDQLTVTHTNSTVTITQDTDGPTGDTLVTFNMSDKVTASTASSTLVGNFGTKTTAFAGGGGSASPVVRGLLMTPQGVVPALDVNAGAGFSAVGTNVGHITKDVAGGEDLLNFGNTPANDLIGYEVGKVSSSQGFQLVLNGFNPVDGGDAEGQAKVLDCSFDPESVNYFAKVLNTDPLQIESRGHYLYMHWDVDSSKATPDATGLALADNTAATLDQAAFCMHTSLGRAARNAAIPDLESFNTRFRTAVSPWFVSQKFGDTTYDLFKIHALDDGEVANDRFRILISNIRAAASSTDWGSFDLSLEAFESDPVKGEVIASWKRLSLDPDSRNFIGRVIGTKHMYFDFDSASSKQRLVEEGEFDVRNKYIRVELSDLVASGEVPTSSLVAGFKGYTTLGTSGADVLVESGTDGSGTGKLLAASSLDGVQPLPLPFVKKITRASGQAFEASEALAWGVKFGKHEKSSELNDIRFNPSMKSWTMFLPDIAGTNEQAAGVTSTEMFSLEKIAVDDASDVDWATSEYVRSGATSDLPLTDDSSDGNAKKTFITLSDVSAIGKNVKYLKFRCLMQGGFDGINIFNKDKAELTSAAAHREANEEVSNVFTGPTVVAYQKALDVLKDKSATEFQLLAIPGMREPLVTDYAITACESRFDAMLVMDIEQKDAGDAIVLDPLGKPSVNLSRQRFEDRSLDTSFAAAYFPDVVMRRPSNSSPLQVPPSVSMLGVMSQNDTLADPWFAPAGLTRGRLNALHSKVQMNRELLNDLYDADINPIYEPAGRAGEVYAFGQKTLMRDQSALDRINVRRLLINIRRRVKAVANTLLFEPNRASTLARFSSLVEPIMSEVQARQGVERYKVQIDTSTTTQNDVENNTIRGKIYLQPTKSVEFISLDFVVTNSID